MWYELWVDGTQGYALVVRPGRWSYGWMEAGTQTLIAVCVQYTHEAQAGYCRTAVPVVSPKPWHRCSCIYTVPAVKQCPPQYRPTLLCM